MATPPPRLRGGAQRPQVATATRPTSDERDLLHYRPIERIGQDELATIYRAVHTTLDRPVQIRVLRRTDWVSSARFQLAGKLAARLSHAHLMPVIDAGHDERYGSFIVNPQLDTRPLGELLAAGPLDPLLVLKIVTQIGTAIDYLHEQSVVHRDVQPANILVTPQGTAYLANFSLAAAAETPSFTGVEETDYVTPYSAPEQTFHGKEASGALDLYALGAVLYHMLSGTAPTGTGAELRPLPAGEHAVAAERIVRRLMDLTPANRYSTAQQAVAALRQVLRPQLDAATNDMEESRWEARAEWLENPLETVVSELIEADFLAKSRARADGLHRSGAIARQLDRWSRGGLVRRPSLGQVIEIDEIVSYNVYLYALRIQYETRTPPTTRKTIYRSEEITPTTAVDLWAVPVNELEPFVNTVPEVVVIPGSQELVVCETCRGAQRMPCRQCDGKGTVARTRRVSEGGGAARTEVFQENCPACRGYGKIQCQTCEGSGQLIEERTFAWSRTSREVTNEDDMAGLSAQMIRRQAQQVLHQAIDLREGRWYQVAPLTDVLNEALAAAGPDARPVAVELTVSGVPVTEVDYRYGDTPHTLTLTGFDNTVHGDATLYDMQRIVLYVIIVVMALVLGLTLFLR